MDGSYEPVKRDQRRAGPSAAGAARTCRSTWTALRLSAAFIQPAWSGTSVPRVASINTSWQHDGLVYPGRWVVWARAAACPRSGVQCHRLGGQMRSFAAELLPPARSRRSVIQLPAARPFPVPRVTGMPVRGRAPCLLPAYRRDARFELITEGRDFLCRFHLPNPGRGTATRCST